MGWLFQNDKLRHQTPVEYITREFTHDNGTTAATVISAAAVGSTIYAAIRNHDKTTGKSYVFCAVNLDQKQRARRLRLQGHGRVDGTLRGRLSRPHHASPLAD